jgi:hypothetical protein
VAESNHEVTRGAAGGVGGEVAGGAARGAGNPSPPGSKAPSDHSINYNNNQLCHRQSRIQELK